MEKGFESLTKTEYMTFLRHPAWLWLLKNNPELLPPTDESTQTIFDTGHMFEQYAEARFPNGVNLGFTTPEEYAALPARTSEALAAGAKTIFQGRFKYEQLSFICDIVDVVEGKLVDLHEVKSSTRAKEEHKQDLAYQMTVLELCGYSVRDISVIHVNNEYVKNGAIDPLAITTQTFVTDEVRGKQEITKLKVLEALGVLALNECPDLSPLHASKEHFREWLDVYKYITKPEADSIYNLSQLDANVLKGLQESGISTLQDIPAHFPLKPKQRLQVEATKQGKPIIQADKIRQFINSLSYPLYFLDYETDASLVPHFDGVKPFQQLPFQFSLHILDHPDAELRHAQYLHTDATNPAAPLTTALMEQIGEEGTLLAWNMSFEKSCNRLLGEIQPGYKGFLENLNTRMVDLMTPFSKDWYVDARFKGSASIKNVLPVLVPELSYSTLEITNGVTSQRVWRETVLEGKNAGQREKILADLDAYNGLDTLALAAIHDVLKNI